MRVLIDVDGVMLRQNIYPPQADCLVEAALHVGGAKAAATALSWDWVGRTDLDILRHAVGARMPAAVEEYLNLFRHRCPEDLTDQVNEEIIAAISEANSELDFSFQPVTGNLESVARIKLRRSGYDHWLNMDRGGYGEGGNRPDILRNALRHMGEGATVYIGDTWRDLAAARLAGVRFIGWETEKHRGELEEADWLVRDADELVSALADAAWCETV